MMKKVEELVSSHGFWDGAFLIACVFTTFVIIMSVLSGCVGLSPALSGKTKYEMYFDDALEGTPESPGQTTKFGTRMSLPAGVEFDADAAGMTYVVNPQTGLVEIKVAGANSTVSTTAQGDVLLAVQEAQLNAIRELVPLVAKSVTEAIMYSLGLDALEIVDKNVAAPSIAPPR